MKLTRSVGYAVGVLLRVASQPRGVSMTAADIAKGCKFPPRFLYRILRKLVDGGMLLGVSGPKGGYSLALPARKIRLFDVVIAVEGSGEETEMEAVHPDHRPAVKLINTMIDKQIEQFHASLKRLTLDDLLKASRKRKSPAKRSRPRRSR